MSEHLDLKNGIEDIVSSYEKRIESISSIFDTTHLILSDLHESILDTREEREKINSQLREILAKNEHLRKKDFDNMIKVIISTQDQLEKEVRSLLRNYFNDQKSMAQALRKGLEGFRDSLAKGETQRLKEFQVMIKEILAKQNKRKEEVVSKLKEFQREQAEITTRFRELLAKGRKLRIKDLKAMLKEFDAHREKRLAFHKKRKEEVARMLGSFKRARQKFRPS